MNISAPLRRNLGILSAVTGLLIVAFVAYSPALRGAFIWDDEGNISENQKLTTWAGLLQIWTHPDLKIQYYPLCLSTFWIEYHLWGLNTLGFHLDNLLLHGLNAWLFWRILKRLELPGAAFAAALFLLHPVHTETVAWIIERKNVLSTMFYFLSLLAWLRYDPLPLGAPDPAASNSGVRKPGWYYAALALFIAALLSKTVTCSLPAVILLLIWWRRGAIVRADVIRQAPFFCVGIILGIVTTAVETYPVGARGDQFNLSFIERMLVAGRALWFYAGKLVWPNPLCFVYPRWHPDAGVWWQWSFPLTAAAALALLYLLRTRIGRGPLVAVLCFAGSQFPMLGFINVYYFRYSFVSDHWNYLGSIFILSLLAALAARLLRPPRLRVAAGVIVLAICAGLIWRQARVYQGPETVWRDTLDKNPECWLAHNNLGLLLRKEGDIDAAIAHYRAAIASYPGYQIAMRNLAGTLTVKGDFSGAEAEYSRLIALSPGAADLYFKIGHIQDKQGRLGDAIKNLQQAVELAPDNAAMANYLGSALARAGNTDAALEQFEHACELDPKNDAAFLNRAQALVITGRTQRAADSFQHVLELDPRNTAALAGLADLLANAGRHGEAAPLYRRALESKPDWPDVMARYSWLLSTTYDDAVRNPDEAARLAEQAGKLAGSTPKLLVIQAAALAAQGDYPRAAELAGKAEGLARDAGNGDLAALAAAHKKLYQEGKLYRQERVKP